MKNSCLKIVFVLLVLICFFSLQKGNANDEVIFSVGSEKKWQLVGGFEKVTDWMTTNAEGTIIVTKSVEGKKGRAIAIDYDLGTTKQWVNIYNLTSLNISKEGYFRLWVKGSGAKNNLEFKLVDMDGSNFIRTYSRVSARSQWTLITIPIRSLIYTSGGNEQLDKLKEISIGVTATQGGKGILIVDELEYSAQ